MNVRQVVSQMVLGGIVKVFEDERATDFHKRILKDSVPLFVRDSIAAKTVYHGVQDQISKIDMAIWRDVLKVGDNLTRTAYTLLSTDEARQMVIDASAQAGYELPPQFGAY